MICVIGSALGAALQGGVALHPAGGRLRARVLMLSDEAAMAAVKDLPAEPDPELKWSAAETVRAVCLGLQFNDYPEQDSGLKRLYHFLHPRGRVEIAPPPPRAGLQGFVSLDDFLRDAASPALGSLLLCSNFQLNGDATISPPGPARGALATQMITVYNNDRTEHTDTTDTTVETLEALIAGRKTPSDPFCHLNTSKLYSAAGGLHGIVKLAALPNHGSATPIVTDCRSSKLLPPERA